MFRASAGLGEWGDGPGLAFRGQGVGLVCEYELRAKDLGLRVLELAF